MGLTRKDLTDPRWTDKDKTEIKTVLDNYMSNDEWIKRMQGKTAVLLTSHPGNRPFLKASVESHRKLGFWLCLAYDNYIHPDSQYIDYNAILPAKDVMDKIDFFFINPYEKYTQEFGNAEGRLGRAIKDLGLKQVRVETPLEDMLKTPGQGTWYKLLGFRHIHAEVNYAYRNKGIPPHYKYLDERFAGGDYPLIKEYWDTQDIKVLERWWPQ